MLFVQIDVADNMIYWVAYVMCLEVCVLLDD